MALQPAFGFAHHSYYKKHQARNVISHVHIWYGRAIIIVGIINGGLGLQLAGAPATYSVAYIIITLIVTALYAITKFVTRTRNSHKGKDDFMGRGYDMERRYNISGPRQYR
jgi:uncharacterized membrane protein YoaK (UPF0700 family)